MSLPLPQRTWTLVHGFMGAPRSWRSVAQHLESHGVLSNAVALPGHGPKATNHNAVGTFDEAVHQLVDRLKSAEQPRCLCGYSLGGRLALAAAVRAPELVDQLVVVSSHAGIESEQQRNVRAHEDDQRAETIRVHGVEAFVSEWEKMPLFLSQKNLPRDEWNNQRKVRLSHDAEGVALAISAFSPGRMPNFWPHLGKVRARSTFVAGALDSRFVAFAHRMSSCVPQSEAFVVDGVGHNIVLEAPGELAKILLECSLP